MQKIVNHPGRVIILGYVLIILIGTLLLFLPFATQGEHSFIDSLFTATSSVCVTGLIVKDTPEDYTLVGKIIILTLIQIGGLGYMTFGSLIFILLRRRLSIRQTTITQESVSVTTENIRGFVIRIVEATLIIEGIGALLLGLRFKSLGYSFSSSLFAGVFYSISGFCNAGFALSSQSLVPFRGDGWIVITMGILIITGGIGFIVLKDIYERLKGKKTSLSLHTKIVLTSTLILLVIPFFFFLLVEWNSGFASFPLKEKILSSFFQTLTPRTAGFHVAEIKEYTLASKILTISLMFIGASPGGTGGGVKTVTFFLIMLGIYNFVKGKYEVNVFRRRIENTFTMRAFVIAGISGVIAFTGVWLLSIIEKGTPFLSLLFEEVSALGTVGLSLGGELHPNCSLVSNFSVAGKLIIIITMLFGRVGSLTLATALITRSKRELTKLPRGEVFTG